jgi:uncharacterized protein YcfJ
MMKKYISTFLMLVMLAVSVPVLATTASAQSSRYSRYERRYVPVKKPSFYRRHRNLINVGIGTGAGALLGGLVGGKKGALIGLAAGAAGSALYTYKLNPKERRYYKQTQYFRRY